MKNKFILLAVCLAFPALLHAERDKTPLAKEMENIARNVRQLGPQVKDSSKRDTALAEIHSIQKSAQTAKGLIPAKAKELPSDQQAAFISDYKTKMDQLIAEFTKLEDAVKLGKTTEAQKILMDLRSIKREGHEKFSAE